MLYAVCKIGIRKTNARSSGSIRKRCDSSAFLRVAEVKQAVKYCAGLLPSELSCARLEMPFGMRTAIFRVELSALGAVEDFCFEVLPEDFRFEVPVATSSRRNLMILVLAKGRELEAPLTWDEINGVITHDNRVSHGQAPWRDQA